MLHHIFRHIGVEHRYLVDLGAGDGFNLSNTRHFLRQRWEGLLVDGGGPHDGVTQEWIGSGTICYLMEEHKVPKRIDLLSIDLDGQDYWVWRRLLEHDYRSRVVIIEFNPGPLESVTVPECRWFVHDATSWYGASFEAFRKLASRFHYTLMHNAFDRNLIFVETRIVPGIQPRIVHRQTQHHLPDQLNRPWEPV
jgi:hypothetical protein